MTTTTILVAMLVFVSSFEGASAGRLGSFTGTVSNYLRGTSNQFDAPGAAAGAAGYSGQQPQQAAPTPPKRKTYWPWQRQQQQQQPVVPQGPTAEELQEQAAYASAVQGMQASGGAGAKSKGGEVAGEAMAGGEGGGYTGAYGAGAAYVTKQDITPRNGIYGSGYTPGAGEPTGVDAGLVGGSQAATDFVRLRNAQAGVTGPDAAGYVTSANEKFGVRERGVDTTKDLTLFQKTVVAALLGPPTAKPGEPGCNVAAESGAESAEKKKIADLMKRAQTNDADRAGKFAEKLRRAQYNERAREACTKAILVNGACSRVAAVEFVKAKKKTAETMKQKYDKTPDRDRDRKGGLKIKMVEHQAAYAAAVSCVKEVMGFNPHDVLGA